MMMVSKNQTPEFQWITKLNARGIIDDVSIGISKNGDNKDRVQLTFRNKKWEHFKTECIMFGIDGDKLYFCETDARTGYKLSKNKQNTCNNRYVQCTDDSFVAWARLHIGDYRLDQDSKSGLYFINAERRTF